MDIQTFFQQSEGKWFSQRTRYNIAWTEMENHKSEIAVELLSPQDPTVSQLCHKYQVNQEQVWKGIKISWDTSTDWGNPKEVGSTILVPLPSENDTTTGQLLHSGIGKGSYQVGQDGALTLRMENDDLYSEERLWFPHENLRLRTTLVKNSQGVIQTAFYSEIRRLPPK